jgi:hypothetical protein
MLSFEQILTFYPDHMRKFRRNILREYLQYKILEAVFRTSYAPRLSFMGGTCIHIVHGSPRFSEDLDLDNDALTLSEFRNLASLVQKELMLEGYIVELKTTEKGAFHGYYRFPSILQDSGLSGHRTEKLLIQIDTEPQGFSYMKQPAILNRFDVFSRILTVPPDILLSQKYLCILSRPRPMGRDFFDASFLMGKIEANLDYLKAKTGIGSITEIKERLIDRCNELDLRELAADVAPLVLKPGDVERILSFPELLAQNSGDL